MSEYIHRVGIPESELRDEVFSIEEIEGMVGLPEVVDDELEIGEQLGAGRDHVVFAVNFQDKASVARMIQRPEVRSSSRRELLAQVIAGVKLDEINSKLAEGGSHIRFTAPEVLARIINVQGEYVGGVVERMDLSGEQEFYTDMMINGEDDLRYELVVERGDEILIGVQAGSLLEVVEKYSLSDELRQAQLQEELEASLDLERSTKEAIEEANKIFDDYRQEIGKQMQSEELTRLDALADAAMIRAGFVKTGDGKWDSSAVDWSDEYSDWEPASIAAISRRFDMAMADESYCGQERS